MEYQSGRDSSQIYQEEKETADHVEYHVIQGADHGYLGANFELAVSCIRDFLNKEQNEDKNEVSK